MPLLHHVFHRLAKLGRQVVVNPKLAGIDDPHVEPRAHCMIKKRSVHCFPHWIVAAKRERNIAHPTAYFGIRQVFFDPFGRIDKIYCIIIMLLNAGSNSEYIRIKNYILWVESNLFR